MLPLRDVIPSRTTPWSAIAIVTTYVLAAFVSAIAHTGWLSILANLLPLWTFGETLEDRLGHGRFLLLITAGAAAAAGAARWITPELPADIPIATGAAAAVLGAYFALFRRSRVLVLIYLIVFVDAIEVPALLVLACWAVLHALALDPLEAMYAGRALLAAQVTGLAIGAALVRPLRRRQRMQPDWWS